MDYSAKNHAGKTWQLVLLVLISRLFNKNYVYTVISNAYYQHRCCKNFLGKSFIVKYVHLYVFFTAGKKQEHFQSCYLFDTKCREKNSHNKTTQIKKKKIDIPGACWVASPANKVNDDSFYFYLLFLYFKIRAYLR